MIEVRCDESYDDHGYVLAGWLAPPSAWRRFNAEWAAMLGRHPLADGAPNPGFHASEIVNRDLIPDSRFRGWSFSQECAIFSDALDVLQGPASRSLWPIGYGAAIPVVPGLDRNEIWHLLFAQLVPAVVRRYPPQNGFAFQFDDKPEVRQRVATAFEVARSTVNSLHPGKFDDVPVSFENDKIVYGLQAADLLAYEWRRHHSDRIATPDKAPRRSFERLMACNPDNAMLRYFDIRRMSRLASRALRERQTLIAAMFEDEREHGF